MAKGKTTRSADEQAQLEYHQGWLETGKALWAAADLIWPQAEARFNVWGQHIAAGTLPEHPTLLAIEHLGYCNAYLFNAGCAVEVLLKAVRIKRLVLKGMSVEFGSSVDQIPQFHAKYDEMARIELGDLNIEEVTLLRRLAPFVNWIGRYPVPTTRRPIEEVNGVVRSPDDKREIDALCRRLIDKYDSLR